MYLGQFGANMLFAYVTDNKFHYADSLEFSSVLESKHLMKWKKFYLLVKKKDIGSCYLLHLDCAFVVEIQQSYLCDRVWFSQVSLKVARRSRRPRGRGQIELVSDLRVVYPSNSGPPKSQLADLTEHPSPGALPSRRTSVTKSQFFFRMTQSFEDVQYLFFFTIFIVEIHLTWTFIAGCIWKFWEKWIV